MAGSKHIDINITRTQNLEQFGTDAPQELTQRFQIEFCSQPWHTPWISGTEMAQNHHTWKLIT